MYDLVFLHPPSSFKKLVYPLSGLFESSTGTTDLLTMIPVGFLSLANELHTNGYKTAIVNVAKLIQQVRDGTKDRLPDFLDDYPAAVYGIDLHWAAHAPGALELANMCKQRHPDSFVLLGGITATYFADEILQDYLYIDGIVQGECDGHITHILQALEVRADTLHHVPNLAWRLNGEIRKNPVLAPVIEQVDYLDTHHLVYPGADLDNLEREALVLNLPVVRGCSMDCLFCGGSRYAYQNFLHRDAVEMLPVDLVLEHVRRAWTAGIKAVKLFGDIRLGGNDYVDRLLDGFGSLEEKPIIFLELFWPASRDFLVAWKTVSLQLFLTLSPESSHPDLRRIQKKGYSNDDLLEQAKWYRELDVIGWFCFAYLLPGHTPESLAGELDFIEELLIVNPDVGIMMQPYLFVDPGSKLFESPKEFGFTITMRTLREIRSGLDRAYWYYSIGYSTEHFSAHGFHCSILDVSRRKAWIYYKNGRLSARDLLKTMKNTELHRRIGDLLVNSPDLTDEELHRTIKGLFPDFLRRSNSNLLLRPFFGHARQYSTPSSMLYDSFPVILELAVRQDQERLEFVHQTLDEWIGSHMPLLVDSYETGTLPMDLLSLWAHFLEELDMPADFLECLTRFEWELYRLLAFREPKIQGGTAVQGGLIKRYPYELTSIERLVEPIIQNRKAPDPQETHYFFDIKRRSVLVFNFNPVLPEEHSGKYLVRELSKTERILVKTDAMVKRTISLVQQTPDPFGPRIVFQGDSFSIEQLGKIVPSIEPQVTGR
ncbi:MAG: radical SAM protein [Bradymonadales bacterium]|nr:radical SAM protein [Bradymonadales bacterium]